MVELVADLLLSIWPFMVQRAVDDLETNGFVHISGRRVGNTGGDAYPLHAVGMAAQLGFK